MSIPMCISCIIPRPNHNPSAPPNSVKNTIVVGLANFVSDIVVRGDGTKSRKLLLVKLSEFWINLSKICLFFGINTEKAFMDFLCFTEYPRKMFLFMISEYNEKEHLGHPFDVIVIFVKDLIVEDKQRFYSWGF